jgi:hypothetical protein
MGKIILIFVLAVALTSCAAPDYSQASTMRLCENVLNFIRLSPAYQSQQNARLEELSRRGEDCSSFMHLRRPVSSDQNINVEVN